MTIGYLQGSAHQFWVCQDARMPVEDDHDAFQDKCHRVHLALQRSVGGESWATFSTPHSWRGDYAELTLSGVIRAGSPLAALMAAYPIFYAALKAGDMAGPDQWFDCKVNRLSERANTQEGT